MKNQHLILLSSVIIASATPASAFAKGFIVLFKKAQVEDVRQNDGRIYALQAANQVQVAKLTEWRRVNAAGSATTPAQDLWLIQGAVIDLNDGEADRLRRESWVSQVLVDRQRKFISGEKVHAISDELPGERGTEPIWGVSHIGVDKIRSKYPDLDGRGINVGILDTGIQSRHPQLEKVARVVFKDFVNGIQLPYDDHGHGTHVAGTIAGVETGIAPAVTLTVGKMLSAAGSGYDSQILSSMQWMFDPDGNPSTRDEPALVSNSWGAEIGPGVIFDAAEFEAYRRAMQSWIQGGILPVFAAGNSGSSPNGIPGGLPEALAVGAIDSQSALAEFSSRGPNVWQMDGTTVSLMKPDISAPGVKITSSIPGNKYATWSGTSMATPHVSGAIALMLQARAGLSITQIKTLVFKSSEPRLDNGFGYGMLNAFALVEAAMASGKQH